MLSTQKWRWLVSSIGRSKSSCGFLKIFKLNIPKELEKNAENPGQDGLEDTRVILLEEIGLNFCLRILGGGVNFSFSILGEIFAWGYSRGKFLLGWFLLGNFASLVMKCENENGNFFSDCFWNEFKSGNQRLLGFSRREENGKKRRKTNDIIKSFAKHIQSHPGKLAFKWEWELKIVQKKEIFSISFRKKIFFWFRSEKKIFLIVWNRLEWEKKNIPSAINKWIPWIPTRSLTRELSDGRKENSGSGALHPPDPSACQKIFKFKNKIYRFQWRFEKRS